MFRRTHSPTPVKIPHLDRTYINYQPVQDSSLSPKQRQQLTAKTEICVHKLYDEVSDYFVASGFCKQIGFFESAEETDDPAAYRVVLRETSRASSLVLLDYLAHLGVNEAVRCNQTEWVSGVVESPQFDPTLVGRLSLLNENELQPALSHTARAIIRSDTFSISSEYQYCGTHSAIWTS